MCNQTNNVYKLDVAGISSKSLAGVTAVFHLIGIVVLFKGKLKQTTILLHVAISETIFCLNHAIWPIKSSNIPRLSFNLFCVLANRLLMLVLLGDRFLEIFLNIKYPVFVTKERLIKVISIIWIASGLYGLITGILDGINKLHYLLAYYISNYIVLVNDITFSVCAFITYGYFYLRIRAAKGKSKISKFNFRIPFLMVATYLIFNVPSTIIFQVYTHRKEENKIYLLTVAYFLFILGFLSDSLLYIFMQRKVQLMIRRKVMPMSTITNTNTSHQMINA